MFTLCGAASIVASAALNSRLPRAGSIFYQRNFENA